MKFAFSGIDSRQNDSSFETTPANDNSSERTLVVATIPFHV